MEHNVYTRSRPYKTMVEYPRAGAAIIMMETGRQYPKEAQMSQVHIHPVPAEYKKQTLMDRDTYDRWYAQSINDPDTFWACLLYTSPSPRDRG